jgi:hypothetical protein
MATANGGTNATTPMGTPSDLYLLTGGLIISQSIYVAVKLGIPDLLADGPKTVDELARLTTSHAPSLLRVLRLLTALSLFVGHGRSAFELAQIGERFRTGVPGSLRNMTLMTDFVGGLKAYDHLLDAVREGKSAFELAYGIEVFEYLSSNPEAVIAFNAAMAERTAALAPTVASGYDFGGAKLIIDIGGNQGTMVAAILAANPGMKGIVFDLPKIVAGADARLITADVADRCEAREGDFFKTVPGGGDYYVLANVLHDWDDEHAEVILRNCVHAMPPQAKVLVIERAITDNQDKSLPTLISDINMMVQTGGKERTDNEHAELFARVGLRLTGVLPVMAPYAIFEGTLKPS